MAYLLGIADRCSEAAIFCNLQKHFKGKHTTLTISNMFQPPLQVCGRVGANLASRAIEITSRCQRPRLDSPKAGINYVNGISD
jgi:hypothetical protein